MAITSCSKKLFFSKFTATSYVGEHLLILASDECTVTPID